MFRRDDENENQAPTPTALADDEQTTEQTDVESDATVDADTDGLTEGDDNADDENDNTATSFSRTYVEKLRRENAGYRERANRADELAQRLHTALVAATGRMADPTDLAFDAAHLDDDDALTTAIDELLAKKPHLASRRPFGDVGQGRRGAASEAPVNLADMLRART
ncbi:hypothetical protein MMAG44476_11069 [Mycolicibacterium mageritense DSM 44476 = CIP 104973]|uniref:Scaffolding protein n=1 Tax=Mycolicibacterium mageritense TaxID=53462 RepID=A0ABN5YCJ5_MYCME|nr:hypothetical protein [Mycolicibacterium mageritense]BBX35756.1 hypothetical protein MMAGJ_50380 [Mycolicibacterium mageritense]CDO19741.1 hypothetical protein BN978_00191 [Mycolicibacterium mageritense DSM 44476 = CIP 104973]